jgi:hypothetical protein
MFQDQSQIQIRLYKIPKSHEQRHQDQRQQQFEILIFSFEILISNYGDFISPRIRN